MIAYEYASSTRIIRMDWKGDYPTASWMGWSRGHWDGDTLVVDVTGQREETWFDRAGDFHSDALHVVERFRMIDGDKTMQVDIHVEDPGAFTTPWNAVQRFARWDKSVLFAKGDSICAESAAYDYFNTGNYGATHVSDLAPIPQADKPDF